MKNQITNEIEEFELHLTITRDFLEKLPSLLRQLNEELKMLDDERQDILHYAELGKFNAYEGYQIARDLKRVGQDRRRVKDLLELAKTTHKKLNGKFNHINLLNDALEEARRSINKQNNRYYRPRIREDLEEKINN